MHVVARLLYKQEDLFQYFTKLARQDCLPSFEDLKNDARKLYHSYTSMRAQERALQGPKLMMKTSSDVPVGSPWDALQKPTEASEKPFIGDQILACSISFIRDTMLAEIGRAHV